MGSAIISDCGQYRYRLERRDVFGDFATAVIMVNPSTADATENDATIRKLIGFRDRWGWGHLLVGNLFAYRSTDVAQLGKACDPIGPENDYHLWQIINEAQQVVAAWGPTRKQPKALRKRWETVANIVQTLRKPLLSIGEPAKCGHPKHPLMLPYALELQRWDGPARLTPPTQREEGR
jgi:hypothetical protein